MRFIAYATVDGQCCDYGWGTRGNAQLVEIEAKTQGDAVRKAFKEFEEILGGDGDFQAKSITIYGIASELEIDVSAKVAENIAKAKAREAEMVEAADRIRYEQLKKRFG